MGKKKKPAAKYYKMDKQAGDLLLKVSDTNIKWFGTNDPEALDQILGTMVTLANAMMWIHMTDSTVLMEPNSQVKLSVPGLKKPVQSKQGIVDAVKQARILIDECVM